MGLILWCLLLLFMELIDDNIFTIIIKNDINIRHNEHITDILLVYILFMFEIKIIGLDCDLFDVVRNGTFKSDLYVDVELLMWEFIDEL